MIPAIQIYSLVANNSTFVIEDYVRTYVQVVTKELNDDGTFRFKSTAANTTRCLDAYPADKYPLLQSQFFNDIDPNNYASIDW